jgi:transposase
MFALLRKHGGLSDAKIAELCEQLFQLRVSKGAIAQSVARTARKLSSVVAQIDADLKQASQVVPDETGFRINGRNAWCHVAVSDRSTRCVIDVVRQATVLKNILGDEFAGMLNSDGWASYATHFPDLVHQQCNAHALRRATQLRDACHANARGFLNHVSKLFKSAIRARTSIRDEPPDKRAKRFERFVDRLDRLTKNVRADRDIERFRKHLRRYLPNWFLYLLEPDLDATNWRAEQAIRPMVIQRKAWGGVKSKAGAITHEYLCSTLATLKQRNLKPMTFLVNNLTNQQNPSLSG